MRKESKRTAMALVIILIIAVVSSCEKDSSKTGAYTAAQPPFTSFRDIPGITAEEIAEIEALQKKYKTFNYGMTHTTEAFITEDGRVGGYAALLCEWLSTLFAIEFQPEVYAWNDLLENLNDGTLDFAGNLISNEERRQMYYMTDAIAERQYKMMRIKGSPALERIAMERRLRYAFLEGAVHGSNVAAVTTPGSYEPVWVSDYTQVYNVLKSGAADAFIAEDAMEASFADYDDIQIEDFLPLIFSPISMSTAKEELAPVISLVTKALRRGAIPYLNYLFNHGYENYKKHKFFMHLDDTEKEYLLNTSTVPLVTQYFNYPIIFFDTRHKKWDGIAMDLLHEVEKLTGLTFVVINSERADMPELITLLSSGEGHIFTDLIHTKEREPYFIWNKNKFMADQYALISKIDYPNVNTNEIPYKQIGLITSTAHKEMFHTWFPDALNTTEYENLDDAFIALGKGDVELIMVAKTKLLYYLNYHETPDYKANFLFNYSYESAFAFNKDQIVLCNIVDKAISIINSDVIVEQWVTKTYDYRTRLAEERLPWVIGVTILSLISLTLILTMLYRSRNLRELKKAEAKVREADERAKLMLDSTPLSCSLITRDNKFIDCNKEAQRLFCVSSKQEYIDRFMEFSPELQPDGERSEEKAQRLFQKTFDEGYTYFEWQHLINGETVPCEVILVRVKYYDDYILAGYTRDLRKLREAEAKTREADERAQIMLEQTPLVVMLWDKDANILDCNQEAIRVTGLSSKEEYIKRLFELTPDLPDGTKSSEAAKKAIAHCLKTGYVRIPWALHHAVTGELIPFDVTVARVKYKGEDVAISYAQDVRERNAAIEKIREADDRARVMIEQAPLVVMLWDKDANILDCNQEALGILGLSSKEEYIERFFEIAPDQPNGMTSKEAAKMLVNKVLETGHERIEWVLNHPVTGEAIPFDSTIARIKYKDEYVVMSYGLDVRERYAAIAKTREADERAQLMIEQAPLVVMLWDKNLRIIDCNQEAVRLFGLSSKQEYIERFFELAPEYQPNGVPSLEMAQKLLDRTLNGSGYERDEWTLKHAITGEPIPFDATLFRIKYKDEYAVLTYAQDLRELRASTKEIMEKTTTLTAILNTAPDLIFVKDLNSRYIQCNKSFEALMGCSCEDIIGKDDAEGLNAPPEVAAAFVAEDKKIFDNKQMVSFEDHIVAADGSKVLFETVKSPLIIDGKMTGLVGVARDITKRKEMEKELLRHHSLMDTVNAAAAVLLEPDTDGGFNSINRSMEMVCQKLDADRVYLWENVLKNNGESSYKQIYKWISPDYPLDNNLAEFSYENTLPYWNNLFSERKSLNGPIDTFPKEEREFLSQHNLQSIMAVPLFFKEKLWGFVSFDDCRNRRFFSKADEHTLSSWGLLVIGAIQRGKIMLDLEHAVTEAKKASAEAMRAYAEAENALEAKSRFIANMNHEMRTPMNVIVGLTDLMLEEQEVPGKVKETLQKINIAGDTLMGLISDVLDISKVEAGKMDLMPVQYDVASMLNDIIALNSIRAEDKPITFKMDINENLFESLFGDDLRVKQIFNNLLSNAFKYTKKGDVTLGVSCQRDGRRERDSVWLSFYVSDTGIGIRKEDIKRLFTDYSQVDTKANRKIDGTGLGLSITKKFVELMDGEISVKSEYGKGTVFSARIRQGFVTDKTISKEIVKSLSSLRYLDDKKKSQKKLERADLSYARVLVVDDFPTNLDVAAGMLRKYKMQVDCVMSGQESVDLITAGKPVYNAIFMDHMMPEMDGVEAVKLIRALNTDYAKNISIIALTANAVAESEKMFLENGFDAFLPKPFNTMSLDSVVQRWVRDRTKEQ